MFMISPKDSPSCVIFLLRRMVMGILVQVVDVFVVIISVFPFYWNLSSLCGDVVVF